MPLTKKLEIDGSIGFDTLVLKGVNDESRHISPYTTPRGIAHSKRGMTRNMDAPEQCSDNDTRLQKYELPVVGFNVDVRIVPGFRYRVRRIGEMKYLFNGEAKLLESIGLGYGRRLTFSGDCLNFWSDSSPSGFAFTIEAIREGDIFTIFNDRSISVGEITVESVDHAQDELETVVENGSVVKNVLVRFTNSVRYFTHHHKLLDILSSTELDAVEGTAELVKPKGSKEAFVRCIKDVNIPNLGNCRLEAEADA